jgi:mRNA interferase RelE/StbE
VSLYQVLFARSARQELEALPRRVAERILIRIETLAETPRPRGCRKLQGPSQLWRIRVGEYRVIYAIDDSKHTVDIIVIRHRNEAYR